MSLCFREAGERLWSQKIDESTELAHLVAHFGKDISHPEDKLKENNPEIRYQLRLHSKAIRHASVARKYKRLDSTEGLRRMFQGCLTGDLDTVQTEYDDLVATEDGAQVPFIQPLATLATWKAHANILRFCLDKGAMLSDRYTREALDVAFGASVEMAQVLYDHNWRKIKSSPGALGTLIGECTKYANDATSDVVDWAIERGARLSRNAIRAAVIKPYTPAALLKLILQIDPSAALVPGALAAAAAHGHVDAVRTMLEAGADVEGVESRVGWHIMDMCRDPGPFPALYCAVTAGSIWTVSDDHVEIARLLLEAGARVDETYRLLSKTDTVLRAAKRFRPRRVELVSIIEKHIEIWKAKEEALKKEEEAKKEEVKKEEELKEEKEPKDEVIKGVKREGEEIKEENKEEGKVGDAPSARRRKRRRQY